MTMQGNVLTKSHRPPRDDKGAAHCNDTRLLLLNARRDLNPIRDWRPFVICRRLEHASPAKVRTV